MERKTRETNRFKWPRSRDLLVVERNDLLLEISEVTPIAEVDKLSTGEVVWCILSDSDFRYANEALKRALCEDE